MKEKIDQIRAEIEGFSGSSEEFKQKYSGKKGIVQIMFDDFRNMPREEKAAFGKVLNELKNLAMEKQQALQDAAPVKVKGNQPEDLSLPGNPHFKGSRHPVSLTLNRMLEIFGRLGFAIAEGPDIEDDWHNFGALNIAESHPARDMQDTFYISMDPAMVLRTHTSNVQSRVMETSKPPIRILAPGRCYRNEAVSSRSHVFFHQVEGLYVDENVSFPDLKQVLFYFAQQMFGEGTKIKLRPSYFPFTEISAEVDVSCNICHGKGCNVCKYSGWVEILGCGMVDPAVLENCGIDPKKYSGYAFGMGVERIAMMNYGIPDLRILSQNDVRFLEQFEMIQP
ncbi:MAG: phenylalanine--tRNA ligase subunit alpha [Bacteroidia bacterium]|nr:phenylalanine--tRNA ligase subunit alpha [Bacteroidia bacterium]